jgi:hypothetical protein
MKFSYICLINNNINYINFFLQNFNTYTKLNDEDEMFFIANDPTIEVLDYLKKFNIPHYIHNNTEEQKKEWFINNIYRAWNKAVSKAKGDYVILLNSNFGFSDNWAENLKKNIKDKICLTSRIVERGIEDGSIYETGIYGIAKTFGSNTFDFRDKEFNNYANCFKKNEIHEGGVYFPFLIKRDDFLLVNGYPEGNIDTNSDLYNPTYLTPNEVYIKNLFCIPGVIVLIMKLNQYGIKHYTVFDSFIYQIQEGELYFTNLSNEFCFYGSIINLKCKPMFIYYSQDSRLKIDFHSTEIKDEWNYNFCINSYLDKQNCDEFFIYRIDPNLDLNILENDIISSSKPDNFLPHNDYYYLLDKVYLKNFIPNKNNLKETIKYYYNNGKLSIIN